MEQKQYKVVVYEITPSPWAVAQIPEGATPRDHLTEVVSHDVTASDPWCAIRHWAEQMEIEESQ